MRGKNRRKTMLRVMSTLMLRTKRTRGKEENEKDGRGGGGGHGKLLFSILSASRENQ